MELTYGSLFTGIGGIDLGLDRAGLSCRWQVENDPYAVKVLDKHWPDVKRYGDIRTVNGSELESVDLICGGFPCQDLSVAGQRAGIEGDRSGLWFEYARILGVLRPRWVLIENVSGLLVHDAMRRVIGELARLGYVGCWRSVRASDFGASHQRKRVFIVAYSEHARPPRAGSATGRSAASGDALRSSGSDELAYSATPRSGGRQNGAADSGHAGANGRGRIEPERSGGALGNAERARRAATGTGRYLDAGPEPEAGSGELADGAGFGWSEGRAESTGSERRSDAVERNGAMADSGNGFLPQPRRGPQERNGTRPGSEILGNTYRTGLEVGNGNEAGGLQVSPLAAGLPAFAPGPSDPRWPAILAERPDLAPALESPLRGMAHEFPDWLDRVMSDRTKRLGRLGNAVVPDIAEWFGARILEFER